MQNESSLSPPFRKITVEDMREDHKGDPNGPNGTYQEIFFF